MTRPRIRILPYKRGSKSAKALADALGGKVLKLEGSRFRAKEQDVIVNWGNTHTGIDCQTLLNWGPTVQQLINKLTFFNHYSEVDEVNIPPFWTNQGDIPDDAFPIVCRTILNGHSGRGIVISDSRGDLVPAPLYVKYIKKKAEFRIHMGKDRNGQSIIIDQQKKVLRNGYANPDFRVRNLANGFLFQRNGIMVPACVLAQAKAAMDNCSLDFGAFDIIFNERDNVAYVLEVNSAPGIQNSTIQAYANYFRSIIQG